MKVQKWMIIKGFKFKCWHRWKSLGKHFKNRNNVTGSHKSLALSLHSTSPPARSCCCSRLGRQLDSLALSLSSSQYMAEKKMTYNSGYCLCMVLCAWVSSRFWGFLPLSKNMHIGRLNFVNICGCTMASHLGVNPPTPLLSVLGPDPLWQG